MSVLDHSPHEAAPAERGVFDSPRRKVRIGRIALYVLTGAIGTAVAIALDPIVNIFAGG